MKRSFGRGMVRSSESLAAPMAVVSSTAASVVVLSAVAKGDTISMVGMVSGNVGCVFTESSVSVRVSESGSVRHQTEDIPSGIIRMPNRMSSILYVRQCSFNSSNGQRVL